MKHVSSSIMVYVFLIREQKPDTITSVKRNFLSSKRYLSKEFRINSSSDTDSMLFFGWVFLAVLEYKFYRNVFNERGLKESSADFLFIVNSQILTIV